MNILTSVKGTPLSLSIYHKEDNYIYTLADNEKYRINIKKSLSENDAIYTYESDDTGFEIPTDILECGTYYFEIELVDALGAPRCISPATDKQGNCNNLIIITERLRNV